MHKKLTCLLLLLSFLAHAQKDTLLYKDYLDYYGAHAKSTVLTSDLKLLKDGTYIFKGDKQDFSFVLKNILKVKDDNLARVDTLYLQGCIKDSIKVGQWRLLYKETKTHKPVNFFSEENRFNKQDIENNDRMLYYTNKGEKTFFGKKVKGIINYNDGQIVTSFTNHLSDSITKMRLRETDLLIVDRKTGVIKYKRDFDLECGRANYNLSIYEHSNDINKELDTSLRFSYQEYWNNSAYDYIHEGWNYHMYSITVNEVFEKGKLISLSITYFDEDKGRQYFGYINSANYQQFVNPECDCRQIKRLDGEDKEGK